MRAAGRAAGRSAVRASAGRALVVEALPVAAAATGGVAVVGLLLALGQALTTAAVAPPPLGVLRLALALAPSVLGIALPVGLLFGLAAAARAWREGGDWLALAASGGAARSTLGPVLALGLVVGGLAAGISHGLEPLGRRDVRRTLAMASGELRLQPGRPLAVGDALVLAQQVEGRRLGEVRLAVGDAVVVAHQGALRGEGRVALAQGQAAGFEAGAEAGSDPVPGAGPAAAWTLDFAQAELRLDVAPPRVELAERTDAELAWIAQRLEAEGRDATPQRLALARRWSLPLSLPLLALLAVPLGARGASPGPVATVTVLAWWAVLRISDQLAPAWGAGPAAAAPVLALALASGAAWWSWRDGGLGPAGPGVAVPSLRWWGAWAGLPAAPAWPGSGLWTHLAGRILGWMSLAVVLLLGLAGLAGVVEGVRWGTGTALRLAAFELLPVVVPVLPVACAVGAGIAAARLHALGEAVALEAVGVAPARVAAVAGAAGLALGLLGLVAHQRLVPPAAEAALALRIELGSAAPAAGWLWTGQALVRTADGLQVELEPGGVLSAQGGEGPADPQRMRQARALRQPVVAGPAELAMDARPLQVEASSRWSRALACGLLAALAWLGPGARRAARLAPSLALGLGYQALSLASVAMAAGGQLPVFAGALLPALSVAALLAWRLRPS